MTIYIVSFLICIILAYIIPRIKNKVWRYILLALIILILSVVGGCRDFIIGTDVEVYGRPWFEKACKFDSLGEYLSNMSNPDKGYLILNFFVSRFTQDANMFLFILQLICNSLVIVTLYRYKDKIPLWLSLLTFLGIYYFRIYNFLRQGIALALVLFSIKYIENKNLVRFIISVLIAATFHYTAVLAIVLYPLNYIAKSNKKIFNYIIIVGLISLVLITFNIIHVMTILHDIGILSDRLYNYTDEFLNSTSKFNLIETAFRILFILLYALRFKDLNGKISINKFMFICLILDVILYQFRIFMSYSDRISLYFGYMMMLVIPQLPDSLAISYKNRVVMKAVIAIIIIMYCYYKFVMMDSCEVYPYTSTILNINYM